MNLRVKLMLLGLSLCLGSLAAAEDPNPYPWFQEPPPEYYGSVYDWKSTQRFIVSDKDGKTMDALLVESLDLLRLVVDDRLQTEENRYLAARLYVSTLGSYGSGAAAQDICQRFQARPDDYLYAATCVWYLGPYAEHKIQAIEALAEQAFAHMPTKQTAHQIYTILADWLNNSGRVHGAIRQYKKAFEAVPPGDELALTYAKENLAIVYANPLLGEKLRRLSVATYADLIKSLESIPDSVVRRQNIGHVSFNKGIAELFLFNNYREAIEDFKRSLGQEYIDQDARVFIAYTYAQLGDAAQSRLYRQSVDFNKILTPSRRAFLQCYFDLAQVLLKESHSVESCLGLESPQTDVLLNLTQVLLGIKLSAADENRMWRRFYRFFEEHILPDLQNSVESVSTQAELEKERADNRLNALKLQNLSLYQYLSLSLAFLAVLLLCAVYLIIRSWKTSRQHSSAMQAEKQHLQHILDSIEEGIINIDADLRLLQQRSTHLTSIIGEGEWDGMDLDRLLQLFDLNGERRQLIASCLRASMGEDSLAWELNNPNLPHELPCRDQIIALFWEPVYKEGRLHKVLLVLRNVTLSRQLERDRESAIKAADQKLELAREILSGHPQAALSFLKQLPHYLAQMANLETQAQSKDTALRLAHTMKGTARTLGLSKLQALSHEYESAWESGDSSAIHECWEQLRTSAAAYEKSVQDIIDQTIKQAPKDLFELVSVHRQGTKRQLQSAGLTLAEIRVVEAVSIPEELQSDLQEILLHALSNAVDHGFVRPHARGVPVQAAAFDINLRQVGGILRFEIHDNGAGIDFHELQELARKRQWQPSPGQNLTDILFESGISTAHAVTQTSGRGVGLSSIRISAQRCGGSVRLEPRAEGGTTLSVEWPQFQQLAA